jgi:hypothetical protein
MNEIELFEHRIAELENNVKILFAKSNDFAVSQAQVNIKLDNLLICLDEVKDSLSNLKNRPSLFWDKLIFAFIGAIGTGIGTLLLAFFKGA